MTIKDGMPMDEFLKHFGVSGMHWGVRRAEKKMNKADKALTQDSISVTSLAEFIEHFGVSGMKWGVRKSRSASDSSSASSGKKDPKHMTDHELKKAVDRLRLEQQLKELSAPQKSAGRDFAKSMLKDSGTRLVGALVGGVATLAVEQVFGQKIKSTAAMNAAKAAAKAATGK
jgi:hypothetical protein